METFSYNCDLGVHDSGGGLNLIVGVQVIEKIAIDRIVGGHIFHNYNTVDKYKLNQ